MPVAYLRKQPTIEESRAFAARANAKYSSNVSKIMKRGLSPAALLRALDAAEKKRVTSIQKFNRGQ